MTNRKLTLLRLQKEEKKIQEQPIPNVLVKRKGLLDFHFCIYGLDGPYQGGYYHGVLQLPQDYPFSPPKLMFFTPSGRFQTHKPICTTFTNFHKQTWTSAWNIRTMLTATISFMTSQQGGVGYLNQSSWRRKKHAGESLKNNMKNPQFCELFKQKLDQIEVDINQHCQKFQKQQDKEKLEREKKTNNDLYKLYGALVVVLILWFFISNSSESNVQ